MIRVRGDGLALAVFEHGDRGRPTIVLVHGYPDSHAVWDRVAEALAARFHVVTYDVRGAGDSDVPASREGYRLSHLAADLEAVIRATAGGRPAHVVGHDWGSIQSWEAVTNPCISSAIASYTSISGPCLDHVALWLRDTLSRRELGRLARQAVRSWYVGFFQIPGAAERLWGSGLDRLFPKILLRTEGVTDPSPVRAEDGIRGLDLYRENVPERLRAPRERTTSVPVQLVIPLRDRFVTPALARAAEPWTDDLTVREMDAGHWVSRSHPEELARLVATHVERTERG